MKCSIYDKKNCYEEKNPSTSTNLVFRFLNQNVHIIYLFDLMRNNNKRKPLSINKQQSNHDSTSNN